MIHENDFLFSKTKLDPIEKFKNWHNNPMNSFFERSSGIKKLISGILVILFKPIIKMYPELVDLFSNDIVALGSVDKNNRPKTRMVLFKGIKENGFSFFTNFDSDKASEFEQNPYASMTFYFRFPPRQVRVEGRLELLSAQASDAYWDSRPKDSQLAAMASKQSKSLKSYEYLIEEFSSLKNKYHGKNISRPENWGGYKIIPTQIEFWEGKANRLHNRELFKKNGDDWLTSLIYP